MHSIPALFKKKKKKITVMDVNGREASYTEQTWENNLFIESAACQPIQLINMLALKHSFWIGLFSVYTKENSVLQSRTIV